MDEKNIILDTDIGTNPDDFFSLLMLLHIEKVNLRLIITGNKYPVERARLVSKILENESRPDILVYRGEENGCVEFFGEKYIDGYYPDISDNYIQAVRDVLDFYKNVVYVNIQGCTNLSRFIKKHPDYKDRLKVYHMGMTTKGFEDFIIGGTNMEADPEAAKHVYQSGINFRIIGSHTTINDALRVHPETPLYKRLLASKNINHQLLIDHLHEYHVRRNIWPALHDPLTVAVALGNEFTEFEEAEIEFNEEGKYREGNGTKVLISKSQSKAAEFMKFCEAYV